MSPEEKQRLDDLENKVNELVDLFYRFRNIDKFVMNNPLYLNSDLHTGIEGTSFGKTDDKLSFYGETPVDQPATVANPSGGATIDSQARTAITALIARIKELGLIA